MSWGPPPSKKGAATPSLPSSSSLPALPSLPQSRHAEQDKLAAPVPRRGRLGLEIQPQRSRPAPTKRKRKPIKAETRVAQQTLDHAIQRIDAIDAEEEALVSRAKALMEALGADPSGLLIEYQAASLSRAASARTSESNCSPEANSCSLAVRLSRLARACASSCAKSSFDCSAGS